MKYRKSVTILVVFIAGLSLLAGIIGILSAGGSGAHTFLSLHGETIHSMARAYTKTTRSHQQRKGLHRIGSQYFSEFRF